MTLKIYFTGIELTNFKHFGQKGQGAESAKARGNCHNSWASLIMFVIFLTFPESIKRVQE